MKRIYGIGQTLFGAAATLLLLVALMAYSRPLERAFNEFVGITETTEYQISTFRDTLAELRVSLHEVGDTLPTHVRALSHSVDVANQIGKSAEAWQNELAGFGEVLKSTSVICDQLASHLPIEVPTVAIGPKQRIRYQLPIFRRTTQRVAGFDIPSVDIDLETRTFEFPGKVDIKRTELMKSEQRMLSDTSNRLSSMIVSLQGTSKSLDATTSLITGDLVDSLEETIDDLQSANETLSRLTDQKLPTIILSLDSQATRINSSRSAISELQHLPLTLWIAFFLMALAISMSGLWKLQSQ